MVALRSGWPGGQFRRWVLVGMIRARLVAATPSVLPQLPGAVELCSGEACGPLQRVVAAPLLAVRLLQRLERFGLFDTHPSGMVLVTSACIKQSRSDSAP